MLRLLPKEQPVYDTFGETLQTGPSRIRTVDILRGDWFFATTRDIKELCRVYMVFCDLCNNFYGRLKPRKRLPLPLKGRGLRGLKPKESVMAKTIVCPACADYGRGRVEMRYSGRELPEGWVFTCPTCGGIRCVTKDKVGGTRGAGQSASARSTGFGPGSSTIRSKYPNRVK